MNSIFATSERVKSTIMGITGPFEKSNPIPSRVNQGPLGLQDQSVKEFVLRCYCTAQAQMWQLLGARSTEHQFTLVSVRFDREPFVHVINRLLRCVFLYLVNVRRNRRSGWLWLRLPNGVLPIHLLSLSHTC